MLISELADRLKSINIAQLKFEAVSKNQTLIVELNRKQMRAGQSSKGKIAPPYSFGYGLDKKKLSSYNAPPPTPDLYVTGAFQRGMFLRLSTKRYFVDSTDSKTNKLKAQYANIFGLNNRSLEFARRANTNTLGKLLKGKLKL